MKDVGKAGAETDKKAVRKTKT